MNFTYPPVTNMEEAKKRFVLQAEEMKKEAAPFRWIESYPDDHVLACYSRTQKATLPKEMTSVKQEFSYDHYHDQIVGLPKTEKEEPFKESIEIQLSKSLSTFPEGRYVGRFKQLTEKQYSLTLYVGVKDGCYKRVTQYLVASIQDLERFVVTKFFSNYMYCLNGNRSLVLAQTSSTKENNVMQYFLHKAVPADPIVQYLEKVPPFILPRAFFLDYSMSFHWMPQKFLIFDLEQFNHDLNRIPMTPVSWVVAILLIHEGKVQSHSTHYLAEAELEMELRGIRPSIFSPQQTVIDLILGYQLQGYTLYSKGYAMEFRFLYGKDVPHLVKKCSRDEYCFAGLTLIQNATWSPYGIVDLKMARFDDMKNFYLPQLESQFADEADTQRSIMKVKNSSHVPFLECLVFFTHWKMHQEYICTEMHRLYWTSVYTKVNPAPNFTKYHFWDERINWICLSLSVDLLEDHPHQKLLGDACAQLSGFLLQKKTLPWSELQEELYFPFIVLSILFHPRFEFDGTKETSRFALAFLKVTVNNWLNRDLMVYGYIDTLKLNYRMWPFIISWVHSTPAGGGFIPCRGCLILMEQAIDRESWLQLNHSCSCQDNSSTEFTFVRSTIVEQYDKDLKLLGYAIPAPISKKEVVISVPCDFELWF